MREKIGLHRQSLTVQMVLSFVGLVVLTAVVAGSLVIWVVRSQIERQAWAQLEQASRATTALYANWRSKVEDLATLTSQRPTLQTLLAHDEAAALTAYLQTLRADTELDMLRVCVQDGDVLAEAGTAVTLAGCALPSPTGLHALSDENGREQIWLLSSHAVNGTAGPQGQVLVGVKLDDALMRQMEAQTGLAHSLFLDSTLVAASLPLAQAAPAPANAVPNAYTRRFTVQNVPYYAVILDLRRAADDQSALIHDVVALDVSDMVAAQQSLLWALIGSIVLAVAASSLLGVFLARRIGHPLTQLAGAAEQFSTGDLQHPVWVQSGVREVSQVAQALEQARADLQQTITALRQSKGWTEHLLESIVEGIVTVDENGRIAFFSPGAERITGREEETAVGQFLETVFPSVTAIEAFSRPQKMIYETADGRHLTLSITSAQLTPPGASGRQLALVLRDVTETEILHRLLGEFLANVTHEFRTPLAALAASAELLRDQVDDLAAAERQELFTSLHLGILGLQTLIDNLLESASLEAGRFHISPHPTDLGELLGEAAYTMRPLQEKYHHHLLIDLPAEIPKLHADGRRTVQVLVNLLSNAIKYSPDGSTITLAVQVDGRWAKVTVADEGPGIPAGYQASLFQPFRRPDPEQRPGQAGAGLGLSVVKAIVEAHG
ncbi:MAG: HAMP domain-containing protein, partial [Anaerolineales bacterium]|nr:HAMP domain-containing protein [Anaerolineales bacterium]